MNSAASSLKIMLATGACAGLTLLACGDDSSGDDKAGATKNENDDTGRTGSKADAGRKDLDAGIVFAPPGLGGIVKEGDACNAGDALGAAPRLCQGCGQSLCVSQCSSGKYGKCEPARDLTNLLGDAGGLQGIIDQIQNGGTLGGIGTVPVDAGFAFNADASVRFTDAGLPVSACPADYSCKLLPSPLPTPSASLPGLCMKGEATKPDACETTADCTSKGFGASTCSSTEESLKSVKEALRGIVPDGIIDISFGFAMLPPRFCAAPCEL